MTSLKQQQRGFTILELLVATLVFATIFLGATTALIQLGKLYYKGVVTDKTQEITRGIVDEVSQQLQFSGDKQTGGLGAYTVINGPDAGNQMFVAAYCIGSTRYTFRPNVEVNSGVTPGQFIKAKNQGLHGLWRDSIGGSSCIPANLSLANPSQTPAPGNGTDGKEMLSQNMRISNFTLQCNTTTHACNLNLSLLYGDNDLLTPNPASGTPTHCASIIGDQWCAGSQLTTTVVRRVAN